MKEPALIIFLFLFSLARLVVGSQPLSTDNNDSETCQTPACHELASRLLNDIDPTVNPCQDFYQFTCGGFINTTDLKNSNYSPDIISSSTVLKGKFLENLETTLEESSSVNEFKYLKLAKTLYRVCYKKISYTDIANYLEGYGGWPVLKGSQWNENCLNSTSRFYQLFYFHYFQKKLFNHQNFSISMEPQLFALTVQDLAEGRNNTKVIEYYNDMIKTAENMGAEKNSKYKDELDKILEFEIELCRGKISAQKQLDLTAFDKVEMTLDELTKNYPFIDWQQFISISNSIKTYSQYNKLSIFTISNFSYLKKLNKSSNSTEIKRLLANYMMWKNVEYKKKTAGSSRKRECVSTVISKLPVAAATIYVQSYNNNSMMINATNDIIKMYSNIKKKFHRMIEEADWIDNSTKNASTQKLELLQIEVGYINDSSNTSKIDEFYEDLQLFDNESYSDALKRIANFTYKPRFNIFSRFIREMFGSPAGLAHGNRTPYSIIISYLLIPQNNYFYNGGPNYKNYGGLGFLIGHEIVHGFDPKNIYFDANSTKSNLLSTLFAEDNFHNRTQCIIEQYGNYKIPEVGLNVNGKRTIREALADNSGMRATYRAYEELSNSDKKLPGLKYTPKQLFWLSYGNAWCRKVSVNYIHLTMNDTHPFNEHRVNNVVSNMPEFSKDFGCPLGSNMNPIKKCTVW